MKARKHYLRSIAALNIPIIIFVAAYAAVFILFFEGNDISFCFIKQRMHLYCPGCGGSRAVMALLKFHPIESFILYPPLWCAIVILAELDVRMALCAVHDTDRYMKRYNGSRFVILAVVIILFFFLRNILLVFFGIDPIGDILHR